MPEVRWNLADARVAIKLVPLFPFVLADTG